MFRSNWENGMAHVEGIRRLSVAVGILTGGSFLLWFLLTENVEWKREQILFLVIGSSLVGILGCAVVRLVGWAIHGFADKRN